MKYRSPWPAFILRLNVGSYWFIIPNKDVHTSNSLQYIMQNQWTMKYKSQWPTFILQSNIGSYWFILPKYYVHTSNSLQDIRQNHWNVKYRSCWPSLHDPQVPVTRLSHNRKSRKTPWPAFILRLNVGSYWFIIPNKDVYTPNSFHDIRQNHWTMKYKSQWPTFILRSNVGSYWFILPKYYVHTSNSLQDIRQNHWNVKYRSCWPSLHDPQVPVTRLSHNRKSRKTLFKGVLDFDLWPHSKAWTLGSGVMEWKPSLQGTFGLNMNAFWWVVGEIYPTWETSM